MASVEIAKFANTVSDRIEDLAHEIVDQASVEQLGRGSVYQVVPDALKAVSTIIRQAAAE